MQLEPHPLPGLAQWHLPLQPQAYPAKPQARTGLKDNQHKMEKRNLICHMLQ
jgi:hypothetical protein